MKNIQLNYLLVFLLICNSILFAQTDSLINGVFNTEQIRYYDTINVNNLKTVNSLCSYFFNEPTANSRTTVFNPVTKVTFNETSLNYHEMDKFYSAIDIGDYINQNWQITGNDYIPSMNFLYNGTLPNFNINQFFLKDTINKSDTLFIPLNNTQNCDSVIISITDDSQQATPHHVALAAPNLTNMYYLPPQIFTVLVEGPRAYIKIETINYNYQTISGKRYLFRNIYSFVKPGLYIKS